MGAELFWSSAVFEGFGGRRLYLMATSEGLCRITWPGEDFEALTAWRDKHKPGAELREAPERLAGAVHQLEEYLRGERKRFELPLDLKGTDFQLAVWGALQRIPFGAAISYSELAERLGRPKAVRAAGAANGCNPLPLIVPCHRVIGKNGSLTGFRGGLSAKETLLRLEGALG